jgi:hypothetical protein
MLPLKKITQLKKTSLLLILLFSQSLYATDRLPEFSAKYSIEKFGIKLAEAHYQLRHTDTGYKFIQDTEPSGMASLFSKESVSAESIIERNGKHLLLKKHRYIQNGSKKDRNEDINISWSTADNELKGTITGVVRGKKINLTTNSEIWEVLSFQIPLMIEADSAIKEYPYNAILKGEINTYHFKLKATENISFADKEYSTLHLVRTDPVKDRQLHIWLIPQLNNIPVIVENYRDGKQHSRMQLESIQFGNTKLIAEKLVMDDDF